MASSSSSRPNALLVAFALGLSVFGAAQLLTTGTGFGIMPTCPSPTTHVNDNVDLDEVDREARRFYERHGFSNVEPDGGSRMLCYLTELVEPAGPSAADSFQ